MNKTLISSAAVAACIISSPILIATPLAKTDKTVTTTNIKKQTKITPVISAKQPIVINNVLQKQDIINQNSATGTVPSFNWHNRLEIGGLANADLIWADTTPIGSFNKTNRGYTDVNINNANIFADATVNPWVKVHINVMYLGNGRPDAVVYGQHVFLLDEAYTTVGNIEKCSFYGQVGRMYVPFSQYSRFPIVKSLTQYLAQTRDTAILGGFVTNMGIYAKVFGFNGKTKPKGEANRTNVDSYGGQIGFLGNIQNSFGLSNINYNVNFSAISNMYNSDLFAYINPTYSIRVAGIAIHGDITSGPISLSADYVTALDKMVVGPYAPLANTPKARLWALTTNLAFAFITFNRNSQIGISYQRTGNAGSAIITMNNKVAMMLRAGIPQQRYMADYSINVWRGTKVAVAFVHDIRYSGTQWKGQKTAEQLIGRLAIAF